MSDGNPLAQYDGICNSHVYDRATRRRIGYCVLLTKHDGPCNTVTPLEREADQFDKNKDQSPLTKMQVALMRAYAKAEPTDEATHYPVSVVHTFRDLARAALAHLNTKEES